MREINAVDLAYGNNLSGLSEQDRNSLISFYDSAMREAKLHADHLRKHPGILRMFYDVMCWHKSIVVVNKFWHTSVDYNVFIDDANWTVMHIVMDEALEARTRDEFDPRPIAISESSVCIDSPYRAFIAKFPDLSGMLKGDGISKVLRKLWIYLFEQRHKFTNKVWFVVQPTSKLNADITCEVRVIKGVAL